MICGYPLDRNIELGHNVYKQFRATDVVLGYGKGKITHHIDTAGGQSGSPILVELEKGKWYAVGIHNKDKEHKKLNFGCYLDDRHLDVIEGWMRELIPVAKI